MTYEERLNQLRVEAKKKITAMLDSTVDGEISLIGELEDEDGYTRDEFYELPTEFVQRKYHIADHKITRIYKEDENYYAEGLDCEDFSEDYHFNLDDLSTEVICYIADYVL